MEQVFIRIQYANGAVREYTAEQPLQFRFAVAASEAAAAITALGLHIWPQSAQKGW